MEKSGRSGDPRVHTSDHGVCREDIQILKTLAAPPQGVKDVLQAVSLLLGHPVHVATNYKKCLMMLSGVGENSLVHLIQARDVQSVDSATASRAREILKPYTEVTIRSMCQASVGLYSWATALLETVESREDSETGKVQGK